MCPNLKNDNNEHLTVDRWLLAGWLPVDCRLIAGWLPVDRRAGGFVPDMSDEYENQALASSLIGQKNAEAAGSSVFPSFSSTISRSMENIFIKKKIHIGKKASFNLIVTTEKNTKTQVIKAFKEESQDMDIYLTSPLVWHDVGSKLYKAVVS